MSDSDSPDFHEWQVSTSHYDDMEFLNSVCIFCPFLLAWNLTSYIISFTLTNNTKFCMNLFQTPNKI